MAVLLAVLLAVLATAAVLVYVRGVKQQSTSASGAVKVIVAKGDIPAGTSLDNLIASGGFVTKDVPRNLIVQGAVTSISQLQHKTTAQPILAGEQVSTARLQGGASLGGGALGIPAGYVAVSLPMSVAQEAAGQVNRGDHVTIFASFNGSGMTGENTTVTLVPDVQVLRADQPSTTGNGALNRSSSSSGALLTLALKPSDAQRVVYAQQYGSVWLALLPPGQKGTQQGAVTMKQVS